MTESASSHNFEQLNSKQRSDLFTRMGFIADQYAVFSVFWNNLTKFENLKASIYALAGQVIRRWAIPSNKPIAQLSSEREIVLAQRWELLQRFVQSYKACFDEHKISVFIGGSVIFGDYEDMDNDIVIFTQDYDEEVAGKILRLLLIALEEQFPEVQNDIVYVSLQKLEEDARRYYDLDFYSLTNIQVASSNLTNSSFTITGYPLYIFHEPSTTTEAEAVNIREKVIDVAASCPLVGAVIAAQLYEVTTLRTIRKHKTRK